MVLPVGKFSESDKTDKLPKGWEPLNFRKIEQHTIYELVEDSGIMVIRASSKGSSSGLIRKIDFDPREYPIISWRWKITQTYEKGDVSKKQGDDYPARIYVTFAYTPESVGFFERTKFKTIKLLYGEYPPVAALNYIWGSKAQKGSIIPNPYTKRAMMIVVESGDDKINTWVEGERNILKDYRTAFGTDPPRISGVAIMTDSDNTKESATTYYGDITFKKGFILQRLRGDGMVFVHAGGTVIKKKLSNEKLRVDTGCIVAFTSGINYDIEMAGGLKSMFFGGEGLFLANLSGSGTVLLQSLPFSRMADRILRNAPSAGGRQKGEGSLLGGIGNLIDGDNW